MPADTGTLTVRIWLADEMREARIDRTFTHGDTAADIFQTLLRDTILAAMDPDDPAAALATLGLPRSLNPWLTIRPDHLTFDADDGYLAAETCWARLDRDGIQFGQPAPTGWLAAKNLDRQ